METLVLNPTASHPLWQHQLGLLLESTGEGIFGIDLDGYYALRNHIVDFFRHARQGHVTVLFFFRLFISIRSKPA